MKENCADFVREVIDSYYPHAVHRSVIGDLGVTTPKQIAKMLAKYGHHHPELQSSIFLLPQVPGAERRSKPIHGVLESVIAAKKYMVPLVVFIPTSAVDCWSSILATGASTRREMRLFSTRATTSICSGSIRPISSRP